MIDHTPISHWMHERCKKNGPFPENITNLVDSIEKDKKIIEEQLGVDLELMVKTKSKTCIIKS
ncbi:hypothetical protein LCGC14_0380910 [marine sediment metagenome]|uniref:Uncharacterized protein n=1 Tax=marine sediment metagenome TaxID=412755 RepID=A0A0F9T2C2_9ZZZZ